MADASYQPGDLVRRYASLCGWSLRSHNIIVEGDIDRRYAMLASCLYYQEAGRSLMGADLAIFPTGLGDEGGTDGIQRQLPTLQNLASKDFDENGRRVFRFVALVDSDPSGKQAARALTGQHTTLRLNRDVFLIQRVLPRETCEPAQLGRLIEQHNEPWKSLDCEIEDLLPYDLLDSFVRANTNVLKRRGGRENPVVQNGSHHFEFEIAVKGQLYRFVEDNAILDDVRGIVELLRSLRYYMGLEPDGIQEATAC